MAEETDLSRNEPASPRRLQAARSAGDVPRSAEFARWVVLLAGLGTLGWLGARVLGGLETLTASALRQAAMPGTFDVPQAAFDVVLLLLPLFAAIFIAALVAPLVLSGWTFAPQVTRADLARVSPFKPFSRLLSQDAWFDVFLGLLKLLLVVGAMGWTLEQGWASLSAADAHTALYDMAGWVAGGVMALALALTLAAALDAGWRWWRYLRRHAMTWQEALAEAREAELPPEVQAQVRARQEQAAQASAATAAVWAEAGPKTSPLPNPGETTKQSTKPASGQVAAYLPQTGEGANAGPKTINEVKQ